MNGVLIMRPLTPLTQRFLITAALAMLLATTVYAADALGPLDIAQIEQLTGLKDSLTNKLFNIS